MVIDWIKSCVGYGKEADVPVMKGDACFVRADWSWRSGGMHAAQGLVQRYVLQLSSEDFKARRDAAEALNHLGSAATASAPALVEAVKDSHSSVRAAAAEALGALGDAAQESSVPVLVAALKDEHMCVRSASASALGRLALESNIPPMQYAAALMECMNDREEHVRKAAAIALGHFGTNATPEVAQVLANQLEDRDEGVRWAVVEALGRLDHVAIPYRKALSSRFMDKDDFVRWAAVTFHENVIG